jgi:hypothetical protein
LGAGYSSSILNRNGYFTSVGIRERISVIAADNPEQIARYISKIDGKDPKRALKLLEYGLFLIY